MESESEKKQAKEKSNTSNSGAVRRKFVDNVKAFLTAILIFLGGILTLIIILDMMIGWKINNPDFLKKLTRSASPSIVFDEKGSIVADMGAVALIKDISVSIGPEDSLKVVVSPVEFLAVEPVLEPLDGQYMIRGQRGQKLDWVFHLSGIQTLVAESSPRRERQRFRLEIIR